jgi:hypothetical protein
MSSSSDRLSHKAYLLSIQANGHYQAGLIHMAAAQKHQHNINSALASIDTKQIMRNILAQGEMDRAITGARMDAFMQAKSAEHSAWMGEKRRMDEMFLGYQKYLSQEFSKFTVQQMNDHIQQNPVCPFHLFECELYGNTPARDANHLCKQWQAPHIGWPQCPYHPNSWYRNQISREINPNPSHSHANGLLRYHFIAGLDEAITSQDIQKCRQLVDTYYKKTIYEGLEFC